MQLQSLELLQPTVQKEIHFKETARMNVRPRARTINVPFFLQEKQVNVYLKDTSSIF